MRLAVCVVAILCSGLHSFASLTQLKGGGNKNNHLLMLVGSLVVLAGVILCFLNSRYDWLIVLIGFGCIAYAAVQNGRRNQNVHLLHHIVRFALFAVLSIGLFFVSLSE